MSDEFSFTYGSIVKTSEKVAWTIEDLFPAGTRIEFNRPHLPEVLAGVREIGCLSDADRLHLNHIRGHSYMNLLAFVEEYIIAQAVRHAEAEMFGDHDAVRALLRFGEEELKHQRLFQVYCEAFRRDFGTPANVLKTAAQLANVILDHSPIAVMLVTLHLEIMTQQHYVGCMKDDQALDPLFTNLLKHHWIEEAQHAKIDVLELRKMVDEAEPGTIEDAVGQYFSVLEELDELLAQQADMDIDSLAAKTQRRFSPEERAEIHEKQLKSYRSDFIVMGMTNPLFIKTVNWLSPLGATRLVEETRAREESVS